MKNTAIVLAGGSGKRMGTAVPKQYLNIHSHPVLYYSLRAFEEAPCIDEVILVVREEDISYCKEEIILHYGFQKITQIVSGGSERFESVYCGLGVMDHEDGYVFVHDGARPCIRVEEIEQLYCDAREYGNAVAATPSKDTVKIADASGYVTSTPNRSNVWNVQTPQVFCKASLTEAYNKMIQDQDRAMVTDDAMVMEQYSNERVHLTGLSYGNIKITTAEDLILAEKILF